jgi:hypothetical protein
MTDRVEHSTFPVGFKLGPPRGLLLQVGHGASRRFQRYPNSTTTSYHSNGSRPGVFATYFTDGSYWRVLTVHIASREVRKDRLHLSGRHRRMTLFALTRRLESTTYCGHTRPLPRTPQLGGNRTYRRRLGKVRRPRRSRHFDAKAKEASPPFAALRFQAARRFATTAAGGKRARTSPGAPRLRQLGDLSDNVRIKHGGTFMRHSPHARNDPGPDSAHVVRVAGKRTGEHAFLDQGATDHQRRHEQGRHHGNPGAEREAGT